jgi:hypothetical protein
MPWSDIRSAGQILTPTAQAQKARQAPQPDSAIANTAMEMISREAQLFKPA